MNGLIANCGSMEMKQEKGFAVSILMHLLILALLVSTTTKIQTPPKMIVVDFSILESPVQPIAQPIAQPVIPAPPVVKPPEKIKVPTPPKPVVKKKVVKKLAKPAPVKKNQIAAIKPKPAPPVESEPEVTLPEPQPQEQAPLLAKSTPVPPEPVVATLESLPVLPSPAAGKTLINNDQQRVSRYTKAQFNHIQRGIQHNINYPKTARRRGWEGKVVVEFIICKDGTVKNIQIVESSGFKVLDQNAVVTIKESAPFPIPPIPAKLIIPVVYRLS